MTDFKEPVTLLPAWVPNKRLIRRSMWKFSPNRWTRALALSATICELSTLVEDRGRFQRAARLLTFWALREISEKDAERIAQLEEKVGRAAATLAER